MIQFFLISKRIFLFCHKASTKTWQLIKYSNNHDKVKNITRRRDFVIGTNVYYHIFINFADVEWQKFIYFYT